MDHVDPIVDPDPAVDVQRAILQQEIALWINTKYQGQVRLRVQRAIDGDKEVQAGLIADLERCERALDALRSELGALADGDHYQRE